MQLGALELHDELGLEVLVPWNDNLRHLAELGQFARTDKEVIGQIDLALSASLRDVKRGIVASKVEVGETPLQDDVAGSRR